MVTETGWGEFDLHASPLVVKEGRDRRTLGISIPSFLDEISEKEFKVTREEKDGS